LYDKLETKVTVFLQQHVIKEDIKEVSDEDDDLLDNTDPFVTDADVRILPRSRVKGYHITPDGVSFCRTRLLKLRQTPIRKDIYRVSRQHPNTFAINKTFFVIARFKFFKFYNNR
jgi:hypothetical protein